MPAHDIIVIGGSAGGVEAIRSIAEALPPDIPAALFLVIHTMPDGPGLLAEDLELADDCGALTPFSCPDCGGVLAEFYDGDLLRFRCQVGHAFSPESMLSSQASDLDQSLWAAFRALDERVNLGRRLVQEVRRQGHATGIRRFTNLAAQAEARKEQLRRALLKEPDDAGGRSER